VLYHELYNGVGIILVHLRSRHLVIIMVMSGVDEYS
jgi:hypothetical protein